jgi:hypothetical protein
MPEYNHSLHDLDKHLMPVEDGPPPEFIHEAGYSTIGRLGMVAIAGLTAFVALGHAGVNVPGYSKAEAKPEVIKNFYELQELCVGGYEAEGTAVAIFKSMGIKKGPIDWHVPGSSITAEVKGTTNTRICQQSKKVDATYDLKTREVTINLPPDSITYKTTVSLGEESQIKRSGGFMADISDVLGSLSTLVGFEGLTDKTNTAEESVEVVAKAALVDAAQTRCAGPAYESFTQKRLVAVNTEQILRSAKTFGINVGKITVNPPVKPPDSTPEFHDKIEDMRNGKHPNLTVKRPKGDPDCTISKDVTITKE